IGKDVELKLFKAVDKQKEFEGTLKAFDDKTITVVIDEKEASFDRDNIAMIRLAFRF
ncbi:MAG: ribosome maturation factor RimP, partial [Lachnospiraceae bacterium]|nr:ribosome maturation factor RimP [Lachnospiraceae bacterium]